MQGWGRGLAGCGGVSRFFQWRPNTFLVRWLPFFLSRAYLGLLGRIYYIIQRQEGDAIRENLEAAARNQAMIATVLGLGIAVPLLFMHAFLTSRTQHLVESLETAAIKYLNVLSLRTSRAGQGTVQNIRAA